MTYPTFEDGQFILFHASGTPVRWLLEQPPVVVGVYDTDRYGELQEFTVCDTSVGDSVFKVDSKGRKVEYTVVVNEIVYGDAWTPHEYIFVARFKGFVL